MTRQCLLAIFVAMFSVTPAFSINVALNKPVTVVSGGGSLLPPAPPPGVVTDGLFLGEATDYSHPFAIDGALRWNTALSGSTTIEIQLGGLYAIDGIIVQADDNDALLVTYLDGNNTFQPLYNVPFLSVGFGFRTRPSADQTTYVPLAVNTTTIRVTDAGGDGYYGISELQLSGVLVPNVQGDCNDDHVLDLSDVPCFVNALLGIDTNPPGGISRSDVNGDSNTDGLDVQFFVDMLIP